MNPLHRLRRQEKTPVQPGYLYIETSDTHPGLLRLLSDESKPAVPQLRDDGSRVRYVARFEDKLAAQMHAHNALRRGLVDIDARLYRGDVIEAIAAVEADELHHQREYLDPQLAEERGDSIAAATERRVQRHRRSTRIFDAIGKVALGWLIINLLVLSV